MGLELLLLHLASIFLLGPAIMVYGAVIVARGQVRLIGNKVVGGAFAVLAGTATTIVGLAFRGFLWYMLRFYRV